MTDLSTILKKVVKKDMESVTSTTVVNSVEIIVGRQGKYSGQLRASNNVSFGSPDLSKITVANYQANAISGEQQLTINVAKEKMKSFKLGYEIHISNNQDYVWDDEVRPGRLAYHGAANMLKDNLRRAIASK